MAKSVWLLHSGVKGMHWYQHLPHVLAKMKERKRISAENAKVRARNSKIEMASKKRVDVSDISDSDLQRIISRLQLESTYVRLINELHPQRDKKSKSLLRELGETTVREVGRASIGAAVDKAFGKNKNSRKKENDDG